MGTGRRGRCRLGREILLVTPIKNEAGHLEDVIRHVTEQTLRPAWWILVDDHSDDGTAKICHRAAKTHPWIYAILHGGKPIPRRLASHVYEVQKTGIDFGLTRCRHEGVSPRYVGVLDADMLPERRYYERLVELFEKTPAMGIMSGGVYLRDPCGRLKWERNPIRWPCGGARLMSRECFDATGGLFPVNSGDTVSAVRALAMGYQVGQIREIRVVQVRPTSSARGLRVGYHFKGVNDFFLGYSPFFALAKALYWAWNESILIGASYMIGYSSSWIRGEKRIDDSLVRDFCRWRLARRLFSRNVPISFGHLRRMSRGERW